MRVAMISRPTLFSAPGGDTVQIKETAHALAKLGVEVDVLLANEQVDYKNYDLLHFFNVIRPNNILSHIEQSELPYVVSTIFVDYSEVELKVNGWKSILLLKLFGKDGIEYIKTMARSFANKELIGNRAYLLQGHKKSVEKVLQQAALLLPNSESELHRLKKWYFFETEHRVIPNAVHPVFLDKVADVSKELRVLCVARIEPIKNQLTLIRAFKNMNVQLELIGKPAPNHQKYFEKCVAEAGGNVLFSGQLERDEVINRLRKAKVHVLPSWFETTGLSSLEAAALGCNIVITKKGDTEEYFEDYAFYCEPDRPKSIQEAIEKALEEQVNLKFNELISKKYTWEVAAQKTFEAYQKVLDS
ncbi:glycosyltransferase family 4 protein [Vicingaceae bacterium]|nr:glycosyltransferase family 4 protein [Vicingaceae bacterium]